MFSQRSARSVAIMPWMMFERSTLQIAMYSIADQWPIADGHN